MKGCIVLASSRELEYKLTVFLPLDEGLGAQGIEPFIDTLMYIMFSDDYLADATWTSEREYWSDYIPKLGADIARSADGVIHRTGVFVIPKAGHSVALEQPEIVNKFIADFISAHS